MTNCPHNTHHPPTGRSSLCWEYIWVNYCAKNNPNDKSKDESTILPKTISIPVFVIRWHNSLLHLRLEAVGGCLLKPTLNLNIKTLNPPLNYISNLLLPLTLDIKPLNLPSTLILKPLNLPSLLTYPQSRY